MALHSSFAPCQNLNDDPLKPHRDRPAMKRSFELKSKPALPQIRWGRLLTKTAMWVSAELVLGVVGADTLADYTEFLNQHQAVTQVAEAFSNLITSI